MTNTNGKKIAMYGQNSCSILRRATALALGLAALAVPSGAALACAMTAPRPLAAPQPAPQPQSVQAVPPQRAAPRDVELYQSLSAPQPANPRGDAAAAEVMQKYYDSNDVRTNAWLRPACTGSTNGCR